MIPAQLTPLEWTWLSPSRRDFVRLGLLNYTPPAEHSPDFETEDGWTIAIERERHAARLEERLRNFALSANHEAKAVELTKQMSLKQNCMVNKNKTASCIKKCLTPIRWRGINNKCHKRSLFPGVLSFLLTVES